ncbi:NAD(P)-binding protein [Nocardioides sp. YIM B13467]|uniref:NAD(P)-binding protein n=1 Tax=Nocardioides sp. YIM B13467 TaxID=3366294 RepID=UPI003672AB5A
MTTTTKARARERSERAEFVDVLIVGAGISGIGTASRLKSRLLEKSFLIIDARENIGGTWDLFRYPGLRADTDAQNFGFESKPWRGKGAR